MDLFQTELDKNVINKEATLGNLFRKTMDFLLNYCNYLYVLYIYQTVHLKCLKDIDQINTKYIKILIKYDKELINLIYSENKSLKYELEGINEPSIFENYRESIKNLKNCKLNYEKIENTNYHKLLINLSIYWTKLKTLDIKNCTNLRLLADLTRFFLYNLYQFSNYFNKRYTEYNNILKNIKLYFEKNDKLIDETHYVYQEIIIKHMILILNNDESLEDIPNQHEIEKPIHNVKELEEFIEITNRIIDNQCKFKLFKYLYQKFYNYQKFKIIIITIDFILEKMCSGLVFKKIK